MRTAGENVLCFCVSFNFKSSPLLPESEPWKVLSHHLRRDLTVSIHNSLEASVPTVKSLGVGVGLDVVLDRGYCKLAHK